MHSLGNIAWKNMYWKIGWSNYEFVSHRGFNSLSRGLESFNMNCMNGKKIRIWIINLDASVFKAIISWTTRLHFYIPNSSYYSYNYIVLYSSLQTNKMLLSIEMFLFFIVYCILFYHFSDLLLENIIILLLFSVLARTWRIRGTKLYVYIYMCTYNMNQCNQ